MELAATSSPLAARASAFCTAAFFSPSALSICSLSSIFSFSCWRSHSASECAFAEAAFQSRPSCFIRRFVSSSSAFFHFSSLSLIAASCSSFVFCSLSQIASECALATASAADKPSSS